MFGANVFWALLQSEELSNFSPGFSIFFPGNEDPSKKSCWEKYQAPITVIPRVPKLGLLGWVSQRQNQNSQSPFLALKIGYFLQEAWWKPLDTRPWGNWSMQKWTMDQGCHYALPIQQCPNRSLLKTVIVKGVYCSTTAILYNECAHKQCYY